MKVIKLPISHFLGEIPVDWMAVSDEMLSENNVGLEWKARSCGNILLFKPIDFPKATGLRPNLRMTLTMEDNLIHILEGRGAGKWYQLRVATFNELRVLATHLVITTR